MDGILDIRFEREPAMVSRRVAGEVNPGSYAANE